MLCCFKYSCHAVVNLVPTGMKKHTWVPFHVVMNMVTLSRFFWPFLRDFRLFHVARTNALLRLLVRHSCSGPVVRMHDMAAFPSRHIRSCVWLCSRFGPFWLMDAANSPGKLVLMLCARVRFCAQAHAHPSLTLSAPCSLLNCCGFFFWIWSAHHSP